MKKIHTLLLITCLICGCSKKADSIQEVDDILSKTETTPEQRTKEWYADQDSIRSTIISYCIDHFDQKGSELGGEYQQAVTNDIFSKFSEIPDCQNARQGEILSMSAGKTMLTPEQLKNIEVEISSPETQDHINQVAQDIANRLGNTDGGAKEVQQ